MVAKVDICNFALQNLGASSITSLTEGSVEASECNLRYDSIRRMVLEMHPWNFASQRASLAKLADAPVWGFANQFQLPPDFVRMVGTKDQLETLPTGNPDFNGFIIISNRSAFEKADVYKIEGDTLLSDDDEKSILYICDKEDTALFPPLFVELLAAGLAGAIAYRVTNSRTMAAEMKQEFTNFLLQTAQTVDAQQDITRRIEQSGFLSSRFVGSGHV